MDFAYSSSDIFSSVSRAVSLTAASYPVSAANGENCAARFGMDMGGCLGGDVAGKIYNIRIILPCFGHAISPFKLNAKLELIAQTNCEVHILNKFSLYKNIQKVLLIHVFDHGYTHTKFPLWFVSDDFLENRRNIRKPVFHENPAPVGWALSGSSPVFTVIS